MDTILGLIPLIPAMLYMYPAICAGVDLIRKYELKQCNTVFKEFFKSLKRIFIKALIEIIIILIFFALMYFMYSSRALKDEGELISFVRVNMLLQQTEVMVCSRGTGVFLLQQCEVCLAPYRHDGCSDATHWHKGHHPPCVPVGFPGSHGGKGFLWRCLPSCSCRQRYGLFLIIRSACAFLFPVPSAA